MKAPLGYITYALDRSPAGIGTYTRELLASLRHSEVEVIVLQAGSGVSSGEAIHLPGAGFLPGLLTFGQVEIGWITRFNELDLVHDPTGTAPLALAGVPCVVTIHDVFPYVLPKSSTTLDRWICYYWLPRILPQVQHVITVSQQSKEDILEYLPVRKENVTVTPEAANAKFRVMSEADITLALERHGTKTPYILYVGSIEPRKNLLRLLQAYALLRDWSNKWHMVIVGARNFWKSSPVVETVKKLDLETFVHFTGYIPEEDLPALYNGADLFLFPSLYEGFGLPVLEAMACGTPVVTSNVSSLPEVAGEAAILVDPYDVKAIAEAMRQVLEDPELAAELREKGLERASQFTWERTARETIAVYEKVLGEEIQTKN